MDLLTPLLAFQHADASIRVVDWLGGMPWFGWIAIVAIVTGCLTGTITNMQKHRERMEMIRQGMHPDSPPGSETASSYKASHPEL